MAGYMTMNAFETDLEALRLLIPSLRKHEDHVRLQAEISALRLATKNGTSTDTPSLRDFNERKARRENILASIQAKAMAQPESFMVYVRGFNLDSADEAFKYSDLIEAIAKQCAQWRQFLLEELDRVLLLCEHSKSRSRFLALQGFAFLEFCRDPLINEAVRQRYVVALRSKSTLVRRAVVDLASGCRISDSVDLRKALLECLSDPDWKVRARSEQLLADEQLLPLGYRPTLVDQIRRRLFTWQI
jgi:hypothetical protein